MESCHIHTRCITDDYSVDWGVQLGRGLTCVTLCRDKRWNKIYALKYMPKTAASLHEINITHHCSKHCPEAVVTLQAAYENDLLFSHAPTRLVRYHLLVLEYMNGGSLHSYFAELQFKYTERAVNQIFSRIVTCLHKLHALNIAHRDVKLENILWRRRSDGEVDIRLSDLAFADFDLDYTLSSECGTAEYQAPETQIEAPRVCRRGGTYTRACDIWSLGVVLYVMLSGCFPFAGQDVKAKLMQDYKFPAATWSDVSDRAKAFVSTLLCAPPRLRPTTEVILNHPWITDAESLPKTYLSALERIVHLPYQTRLEKQAPFVKEVVGDDDYSCESPRPGRRRRLSFIGEDMPHPAEDEWSNCITPTDSASHAELISGPTKSSAPLTPPAVPLSLPSSFSSSSVPAPPSKANSQYQWYNTFKGLSAQAEEQVGTMRKFNEERGFGCVGPVFAAAHKVETTSHDVDDPALSYRHSTFTRQPICVKASNGGPLPEWVEEDQAPIEWQRC